MMNRIFFSLMALFLLGLAAILAAMLWLTEFSGVFVDYSQWAQFLGRFHPVILHLPIGLFFGLAALESLRWWKRSEGVTLASLTLAVLTAVSGVAAAVLGLLLAANGDYSGDNIWWHKWLGVVFCFVSLSLAWCKLWAVQGSAWARFGYVSQLLVLGGLLPVVGHLGGNLTHGSNYLVDHAPAWLQEWLGEGSEGAVSKDSEDSEDSVSAKADVLAMDVYTQQVAPLLQQYCVSCHGPDKQKSGYRLDTYEWLLKPGRMGDLPIVPFEVSESALIEYLWLPESDDMAMPPEGKPRLSAEEIMLITHWVAVGAEGPVVDPAVLQAQLAVEKKTEEVLAILKKEAVLVLPIAQGESWLSVDFQNVDGDLSMEAWSALAELKDRVVELRMSDVSLSVDALRALEGATALTHVNLSGCQGLDTVVPVLNSFTSLVHLNVFGSDFSDDGLHHLSALVEGKLYVGSTAVTQESVQAYAGRYAAVQVVADVDLTDVQTINEIGANNSSTFYPGREKK